MVERKEAKDICISNKTIMIMLIAVIIVSTTSLILHFTELRKANSQLSAEDNLEEIDGIPTTNAQGAATLGIIKPGQNQTENNFK